MNKGLSLLGLAFRSGNLVSGEFAAREAVRKKTAALIIVANDASDNTKKMFENQCKHYQVPFYCWGLKEELGHAIGKEFRASIAVTDQGFAEALLKQLDKYESQEVYLWQNSEFMKLQRNIIKTIKKF